MFKILYSKLYTLQFKYQGLKKNMFSRNFFVPVYFLNFLPGPISSELQGENFCDLNLYLCTIYLFAEWSDKCTIFCYSYSYILGKT